jgi:hypothetical protein
MQALAPLSGSGCGICPGTGRPGRRTSRRGPAILRIRPFVPLTARDTGAIEAQGAQLLEFAAEDAEVRDVRVAAPG